MMTSRVALASSAAAIVAAGALLLFPPFVDSGPALLASDKEMARAVTAFSQALLRESNAIDELDQLGLTPGRIEGVDRAVLLKEDEKDCTGRGIYWINQDQGIPLAITAPHRGSDRHTGTLAATLFVETNANAAAWNSAPRRTDDECDNAIDLTRTKDHLFNAFNLGFAQAMPTGLVVQLHGFDGERRATPATQDAAMILSNGTREPGERLLRLADELSLAFAPLEVLVFPIGSQELGATQNAQGQLLRESGFDGFVHIEISAQMRAAMVQDADLRAQLSQALVRAAQ